MLCWIFGDVEENIVTLKTPDANAGTFKLKNVNVRWFLSVNYDYIPEVFSVEMMILFQIFIGFVCGCNDRIVFDMMIS